GAGARLHGAEPVVGGRKEFGLLLVWRAMRRERGPLGVQHAAMHDEVDWLAGEGVAGVLLAEQVVAVDAEAARSRRAARRSGQLEQLQRIAERVEPVAVGTVADDHVVVRGSDVRIAAEVVVGERIVAQERAVVAAEPVAPVVANPAMLRPAGGGFDDAGVRVDAGIAGGERPGFAPREGG